MSYLPLQRRDPRAQRRNLGGLGVDKGGDFVAKLEQLFGAGVGDELAIQLDKARGGESRPNQGDQRGNLAGRLLDAGRQPALVVGEAHKGSSLSLSCRRN